MAIYARVCGALKSFLAFKGKKKQHRKPAARQCSTPSHRSGSQKSSPSRQASPIHQRLALPAEVPTWATEFYSAFDIIMWQALANEDVALKLFANELEGIAQSIEVDRDFDDDEEEQLDANASLCVLPNNRYDHLKALEKDSMDYYSKLQGQVASVKKLVGLGWHEDTIIVFLKLDRRGFEPLFPRSWMPDFPLFPGFFFCPDGWVGGSLIKNIGGSEFRAIRAFDAFCMVGQLVRDAGINYTSPGRRPEAIISRSIKKYIKWAWADACLAHDLQYGRVPDLLAIVTGKPGQTAEELDDIITDELKRLSGELHNTLRHDPGVNPYPTIFGMVIYGSLVGVVAYEPMNQERDTVRTIGFYRFDIRLEECWNCISLAILIHYIRHQLLRLQQVLHQFPPLTMREYTPVPPPAHITRGSVGHSSPEYQPSSPGYWLRIDAQAGFVEDEIPHPPYSPLTPAISEAVIKEEPESNLGLKQESAAEDEESAAFADVHELVDEEIIAKDDPDYDSELEKQYAKEDEEYTAFKKVAK